MFHRLIDGIHVRRRTSEVNRDNGLGLFCDGLGDIVGLHQQCVIVYIDKYGLAPESTTWFTVEAKVMEGVMTSWPLPIPICLEQKVHACRARAQCKAWPEPVYRAKSSSNRAHLGPVVIHPDFMTSVTASISSIPKNGLLMGMNSSIVLDPQCRRGLAQPPELAGPFLLVFDLEESLSVRFQEMLQIYITFSR